LSVLSDREIIRLAAKKKMIEPFEAGQVRQGVISFGTSSYGYDFRLSDEFHINQGAGAVDPKAVKTEEWNVVRAPVIELAPGQTVLGRTVEYFRIPRDIITVCFGKSTYARCGVLLNVTPFEPEWEGFATIAVTNASSVPVKVYANEGIGQLLFLKASRVCKTSYADKKGKYQKQTTVTKAKI
jgi:dCTP deaminase